MPSRGSLLACRAFLTVEQTDDPAKRVVHGAESALHLVTQAAYAFAQVKLILAQRIERAGMGTQLSAHFRDVSIGAGREHSRRGTASADRSLSSATCRSSRATRWASSSSAMPPIVLPWSHLQARPP